MGLHGLAGTGGTEWNVIIIEWRFFFFLAGSGISGFGRGLGKVVRNGGIQHGRGTHDKAVNTRGMVGRLRFPSELTRQRPFMAALDDRTQGETRRVQICICQERGIVAV